MKRAQISKKRLEAIKCPIGRFREVNLSARVNSLYLGRSSITPGQAFSIGELARPGELSVSFSRSSQTPDRAFSGGIRRSGELSGTRTMLIMQIPGQTIGTPGPGISSFSSIASRM